MERLYRICFDTQRDRQYITWGLFVTAPNKKGAKSIAEEMWYCSEKCPYRHSEDRPHMFHTDSSRMNEDERDRPIGEFFKIESRYAYWGRR